MRPRHATSLPACLLALVASTASLAEQATDHAHRAACVAALTTQAEPLAARLKGGDHSVEAELLALTTSGFALIGIAYQEGLRKPEADRLLDAAKRAQKSMSTQDLSRLQASCRVEGAQVLTDASSLERFLVNNAAERRVKRIADGPRKR